MAEHAGIDKAVTTDEETGIITVDETINAEGLPVEPRTIARTIVFVITWVNMLFTFFGLPAFDFDPDAAYVASSAVITLLASTWGFWKNNSYTIAAKVGDLIMGLVRKSED